MHIQKSSFFNRKYPLTFYMYICIHDLNEVFVGQPFLVIQCSTNSHLFSYIASVNLIQSWANFEPPKTIVKRMVVEEHQKVGVNKPSFLADKQQFSPHKLEGLALSYSNNNTTPSTFLYSSRNKGKPSWNHMDDIYLCSFSCSKVTSLSNKRGCALSRLRTFTNVFTPLYIFCRT